MNSAWALFLAKMIVLPSRSPPATRCPLVMSTLSIWSTVSVLNSHLLTASPETSSGGSSSPHSSMSQASLSASDRVGVADALALELQRHGHRPGRDQIPLTHGLVESVGVGRHPVLKSEQRVRVAVDLVLRGRGEPDQQGVEPAEDRAVLLVDRPVGLVDDDQVEVPGPEAPPGLIGLVDQAHHRGVGRDVDAPVGVLLRHQVHRRGPGQVRLERVRGLVHQGDPVGEEQHPLAPVGPHQLVHQRDHGARLARAGGHHDQGAPLGVLLEGLIDRPDRAHLVVPTGDLRVDLHPRERHPAAAPRDHQRQLVLGVEALHLSRRVAQVVPHPVLVTVGAEDDRPLPEGLLQTVRVQLRLLLTDHGISPGALGLHHTQGLAVVTPQHVVDEALALSVGHAGDLELPVPRLVQRPPASFSSRSMNRSRVVASS